MPPPTALPTSKQFKSSTRKVGAMRKSIAKIDAALDQWSAQKTLDNAVLVYKESRHWLKAKAHKDTSSSNKRKTIIRRLANQSLAWIYHLDPKLKKAHTRFETNKLTTQQLGSKYGRKSMHGVYKHERAGYLKSNKATAPSATIMHNKAWQYEDFKDRDFSTLSEQEYDQLDRLIQKEHSVSYLKKMERLRYMVDIEDKLLKDFDGTPITTSEYFNSDGAKWAYAIDVYGNMFTKPFGGSEQENHSTFNAGNAVICAGTIAINAGLIVNIDNASGHYKPGRSELFDAVALLMRELGSSNTRRATVTYYDHNKKPGVVCEYVFPFAAFTKNPSPRDDRYLNRELQPE